MTGLVLALAPLLIVLAVLGLAGRPALRPPPSSPAEDVPGDGGARGWRLRLLYLFHLRYPILLLTLILGLPGWGRLAEAKLGNWMVVEAGDVFLLVAVAELAAAAAVYTWWLSLTGLPERMDLAPLTLAPWAERALARIGRALRFLGPLERSVDRVALGGALLTGTGYGAAAAFVHAEGRGLRLQVAFVALLLSLLAWRLLFTAAPHLRRWVQALALWLRRRLPRQSAWIAAIRGRLGPGFGATDGQAQAFAAAGRRLSAQDHGWMLARLILGVVVYGLLFLAFQPDDPGVLDGCRGLGGLPWRACFPAVAYVLLLGAIVLLLMSFLAFLLDYVRIPALPVAVLLALLSFRVSAIDHFYPVSLGAAQDDAPPLGLAQAMQARLAVSRVPGAGERLVVVATAGGGITAAGWTATVLGGLDGLTGGVFSDRLAAISSVSGGSFSSALYLDELLAGGRDWEGRRARLFAQSTANSLRSAFWGMAFPDLLRLFRPGFWFLELRDGPRARIQDRAWAMEEAWRRRLADERPAGWVPGGLAAMGRAAAEGRLPVPIINAMLLESGAPYALTPLALPASMQARPAPAGQAPVGAAPPATVSSRPPAGEAAPCPFVSFGAALPDREISVLTAARLSATFPYVTPMSRPVDPERLDAALSAAGDSACRHAAATAHVGDGGYFDNFGVATLATWLDDAIVGEGLPPAAEILWINVYWEEPGSATLEPLSGAQVAWQGPFTGLVNARGSTQRTRNRAALTALTEKWNRPACPSCPARERMRVLDLVLYEDLPLNWQLAPEDAARIADYWDHLLVEAQQLEADEAGSTLTTCANAAAALREGDPPQRSLELPLHELPPELRDGQTRRGQRLAANAAALREIHAFLCRPAAEGGAPR